jgi:hypothetical protein
VHKKATHYNCGYLYGLTSGRQAGYHSSAELSVIRVGLSQLASMMLEIMQRTDVRIQIEECEDIFLGCMSFGAQDMRK